MVKIAYCIYGMSYGKHNAKDNIYSACKNFENWREQIFSKYDVDIFIHTWNEESRKEIEEIIKPKKFMIENINNIKREVLMIDKYPSNEILLNNSEKKILKGKINNKVAEKMNVMPLMYGKYSRFYSMYQADKLRREYEIETQTKYDIVINTRFDVYYTINTNLLELDYSKIYCVLKKNMKPIYLTTKHPNDYMYMSNSDNMTKMCQIWINLYDIYNDFLGKNKYKEYVNSHRLVGKHIHRNKLDKIVSFLSDQKMYIDHNSTVH